MNAHELRPVDPDRRTYVHFRPDGRSEVRTVPQLRVGPAGPDGVAQVVLAPGSVVRSFLTIHPDGRREVVDLQEPEPEIPLPPMPPTPAPTAGKEAGDEYGSNRRGRRAARAEARRRYRKGR